MSTVTIPKKLAGKDDLIVIPRTEYERMVRLAAYRSRVTATDVIRWAREARNLNRQGKLPVLRSLKDLR